MVWLYILVIYPGYISWFFSILSKVILTCNCFVRWNFIEGCMNTCTVVATLCYSSKVTNGHIAKYALC